MGWRHKAEERLVVVGTIRSDRVVRKDFEADDRLPLSCPWEVLPPQRGLKPDSNPTGIDRCGEDAVSTTPPQLDRTVTRGQVSRVSTLSPRPSSGWRAGRLSQRATLFLLWVGLVTVSYTEGKS